MSTTTGRLFGDETLAHPHRIYAQLRETGPVHRTTTPGGAPVWFVTRYQDVRAALADPRLSLDKANATTDSTYQSSMPSELDAHLLNMDPPDHTRLRRLVSKAFTPRRIEGLRELIQARTDELLDAAAGPPIDLMKTLAYPLPMAVICELLGIPADARHDFRAWTNTLVAPEADAAVASRAALKQMHQFLADIIAAKRAEPSDDFLSAMIEARDAHDRLTEPELIAMAFLTLYAGYDNAVNLIGTATLALLTHPEQMAAVRDGRIPIRAVLEEAMRWNSPFPLAVRRFALEELTIAGVRIPAGARVWLSLLSANRDSEQFTNPDTFDSTRTPAHLGYGHGIHYCLGAPLARLEAETALSAVLHRYPKLALAAAADQLTWVPSFQKRGLQALPVTW
ncbi:cytochrome P450 family protein [Streptoverticillium reticulum]|uniref:cytochrome P450 family protein n=1 Tax=Streptomyces TaxID=1883 RepID=UPI003692A830